MEIYVNNTSREINPESRIKDVLLSLNITTRKGIAIAINNQVVPLSEWDSHLLKNGDKLTLIRATQGG
jgi:sulfur carrier protein